MRTDSALVVVRASTHNLKDVSCRIPHGKVTVVTGPSGAGKSSLAFDTVYAEAQRRFVESMSTYARQFLEKMERPPVEDMHGILPAVALVARNSVQNARSTVGTLTEVHDLLRLLMAHVGEVWCPQGHGVLEDLAPAQVAARLSEFEEGRTVTLVAPLGRPKKNADLKLRELVRQGYFRILDEDKVLRLKPTSRWFKKHDPLKIVLGRFKTVKSSRSRIAAAVEQAYKLSGGKVEIEGLSKQLFFGQRLTCAECGDSSSRPLPALFSFNSPLGACQSCQGFGRVIGVDHERVIPEATKSLRQRPIAVWNSPTYSKHYPKLWAAAAERGVPLDLPWCELSESDRNWVWSGRGDFTNLDRFFAWLERRNYRMHVRVLLSRYRAYERCAACDGQRLQEHALRVLVRGKNVAEIAAMSIEDLRVWLKGHDWTPAEREVAAHLCEQLDLRLDTLVRVGLGYLALDRQARTLSGGEAQRIQLSSALGCGLTTTLYILDEPTIGLHPKDSQRLLALLRHLASRGNTVLVVEHDRTLIRGADHVIDLGPGAGVDGGELVAEGSFEDILASDVSLTARYMRDGGLSGAGQGPSINIDAGELRALPSIGIRGARANNLRSVNVDIPVGCLVVITGVSGSGKSSLVQQVLHANFQRSRGVVEVEPGPCDALENVEDIEDIVLVDQRPIGRSSRSNPVTYVKAYDEVRKLFASTHRAQRDRITAGHFSFNVDKGRCQECQGTGIQEVDMHFMAAVRVTCELCQGKRFEPDVLAVTYRGLNIAEVLELTVDEARQLFRDRAALCRRLQVLVDVGLGYLHLGQPTATLSGGEAQRLKLATFLGKRSRGQSRPRLFLFDEPTTGLHMADIDLLHRTLRRLIERGDGVAVVEHSLDLIAVADWIVDLGPGGGDAGGELLFSGPREDFLSDGEGATADELRRHLCRSDSIDSMSRR